MFTVVIPLYNKEQILLRTLASVLTQTYSEFEVLIVNDGSTDNSLEVAQKLAFDSRIRIINQENQGVSAARNTGVAHAKYDYIAFLDADDEWLPSYLQKIREAIELFPEAALYGCPSWHRDIMTGQSGNTTLNRYKDKIQIVEYFENPHAMPHTSATVVAKKYFNRIDNGKGFCVGMKVTEDWTCFYRLAFQAPLVYIGYPLGIRNNGVIGQITGSTEEQRFKLLPHIANYYNITYRESQKSSSIALFKVFFRYDLRNQILCALRKSDYRTIEYLYNALSADCMNELSTFEKNLYKNQALNSLAKIYIYITKLIWRRHGYPIVGKN